MKNFNLLKLFLVGVALIAHYVLSARNSFAIYESTGVINLEEALCDTSYKVVSMACTSTVSTFPYTEGFESGLGLWTQETIDDRDWTRRTGSTPSSFTGPSTANEGNWYMFTESSSPNLNSSFILNGPCFNLTGTSSADFSFYYHMYGIDTGTLFLELSTDNGATYPNILWSQVGQVQTSSGQPWELANVNLSPFIGQTISLRFRVITGSSFRSDIAIDNISLIAVSNPQQEIEVSGNGLEIVNGDTNPASTDGTDFGDVSFPAGNAISSFVISNLGGVNNLNLMSAAPYVFISGAHAGDFSVTNMPTTPITAGNNTSFDITFTPSAIGLRTASVSIANNDADENPYTFSIQGTGVVAPPCGDLTVHTADFELNNDGWSLSNANRINDPVNAYRANHALRMSQTNSVLTSPTMSLWCYDLVEVEFFYRSASAFPYLEGHAFRLEYSSDGGSTWINVRTFTKGTTAAFRDFNSNAFHAALVPMKSSAFNLTVNGRFRFVNTAPDDRHLYIDAFTVNGVIYSTPTHSPGGVDTDVNLWLRADQITGVGLLPNNTPVNRWKDVGAGNITKVVDSVNTTLAKPVYRNDPAFNVNFNPVVTFSNNTATAPKEFTYLSPNRQFLHSSGGLSSHDIYAVVFANTDINSGVNPPMDVFVGRNDISNPWDEDVTGFGLGNFSARYDNEMLAYAYGSNPTPVPSDLNARGYGIAQTGSTNYTQLGILNFRNNTTANGSEIHFNGLRVDNLELGLPQFTNVTNNKIWIGRSQAFDGSFDGKIAEIITYDSRKDDASERNRIESYLAIKYGITLGVNGVSKNYVDSDGNVLYTAGNGFNYNVTGIGRDDVSGLNQKQSKSIHAAETGDDITIGLVDIYSTNSENPNSFDADKNFLIWGHDNASLNAMSPVVVNLSAAITPALTTDVEFTGFFRTWRVEEIGAIGEVKVSLPNTLVANLPPPPGNYLMFVSDTPVFSPSSAFSVMEINGSNIETIYDFDGTKYITFGFAPERTFERSIFFNGVTDYLDAGKQALNLGTAFTISAWINRASDGTILSKRDGTYTEGYDLSILSDGRVRFSWQNVGMHEITSSVAIPTSIWHHIAVVYDGSDLSLYIDGVLDNTQSRPVPPVDTNRSFLVAAADGLSPTDYFQGNIDEVRIWDTTLSVDQLRYIMNQEIEENAAFVVGKYFNDNLINPTKNETALIPWSDLAVYYPMSTYTYTNCKDESENNYTATIKNLVTVDRQTAPLPYRSTANGAWVSTATWQNGSLQSIPGSSGLLGQPIEGNIVEIGHDIELAETSTLLALNSTLGELTVFDEGLTITHYLRLNGDIDLAVEAQLVQTQDSDLDPNSAGKITINQQGTSDRFSYNYWSSPVGTINTLANNVNFTVASVMKDGTNPSTPLNINFVGGVNGSPGTPISIANAWIYKFTNATAGQYALWQFTGSTGNVNAGEGWTMKGHTANAISTPQNYTFVGKPNNGQITLPINSGNNYLIGNPYPSALDAHTFILANPQLNGTLYFWEHWGGGSHVTAQYQGGYALYNFSGGVPNPSFGTNHPDVNQGGTPTKRPGRYVSVAQGFFVEADNNGTITFDNDQRAFRKEAVDVSVFIRDNEDPRSAKSFSALNTDQDDRWKFRIGFDTPNRIHRQLLLTVDQNSTYGYDRLYDGRQYDLMTDDMVFKNGTEKLTIQALPFIVPDLELPLEIKMGASGTFTISIDSLENVPNHVEIYVKNIQTNTYHDLRAGDFTSPVMNSGFYNDIYAIVFNKNTTLSTDDFINDNDLIVYTPSDENSLNIKKTVAIDVEKVTMYNLLGQEIRKWQVNEQFEIIKLPLPSLAAGNYIVKIQTNIGELNKKIVLN